MQIIFDMPNVKWSNEVIFAMRLIQAQLRVANNDENNMIRWILQLGNQVVSKSDPQEFAFSKTKFYIVQRAEDCVAETSYLFYWNIRWQWEIVSQEKVI